MFDYTIPLPERASDIPPNNSILRFGVITREIFAHKLPELSLQLKEGGAQVVSSSLRPSLTISTNAAIRKSVDQILEYSELPVRKYTTMPRGLPVELPDDDIQP